MNWLALADLLLIFALKLTCFWFGYKVVQLGANLLREGVRGEFKFHASLGGPKADLASASPGLLFLVLGIALIAYAMWVTKIVQVNTVEGFGPPPSVVLPSPSSSSGPSR